MEANNKVVISNGKGFCVLIDCRSVVKEKCFRVVTIDKVHYTKERYYGIPIWKERDHAEILCFIFHVDDMHE